MKLYISDLALIALAIFYLPFVLLALWKIVFVPRWSVAKKSLMFVIALIVAYAIPLGDVTVYSFAMHNACKQAGLHIYQKVRVEGYLGSLAGPATLKRIPYRFIERHDYANKILRYERQADGSITETKLDHPTAEYEVVTDYKVPPGLGVGSINRDYVRNRRTGEIVGEWLGFGPKHGWVDRYTLVRWFGAAMPGCQGLTNWPKSEYPGFPAVLLPPTHSSNSDKGN